MVARIVNGEGVMTEEQAYHLPPLTLAYIGDAVWEMRVRLEVVQRGERQPRRLHRLAVELVRAKSQADRLHAIAEHLTEREKNVVRRGRNAKSGSMPRNAEVSDYRMSTGFEALLGYLYLAGLEERLGIVMELLLNRG